MVEGKRVCRDAVRTGLERDRIRHAVEGRMRELKLRFESLSEREREVMSHVTAGLLNKQIAGRMKLSEVTVKVHRHKLMHKLGAKSVPELVKMEQALGPPHAVGTYQGLS